MRLNEKGERVSWRNDPERGFIKICSEELCEEDAVKEKTYQRSKNYDKYFCEEHAPGDAHVMSDFYDMLEWALPNDYNCSGCGEAMWVEYESGHMWYDCLNCDYEKKRKEKVCAEGTLELAGYVCDYPVPQRPAPETIEIHNICKDSAYRLQHERRYYRRRKV